MVKPEDWQADYEALTTGCGAVKLDRWSQVRIGGADRVTFLHNMCTNEIRQLGVGESCEAFCTDVRGKIVAYVSVVALADSLLLLTVPDQAERLIAQMDRYIIREDVLLEDATIETSWHFVLGPAASEVNADPNDLVVKNTLLWPGGFLVRTLPDFQFPGCRKVDATSPAWTALRIESGWPLFGIDFDDTFLPQEIDRDERAINFKKGCYLGQETVARIDALGHVNKKLVVLKFSDEQIPAVGSKLTQAGQEVGTITTAGWSPLFNAPAAIAVVRRNANALGSQLESETGKSEVISPAVPSL